MITEITANFVLLSILVGCAGPFSSQQPRAATNASNFRDPFAYCAALGTIDAPDSRYHGPRVTETIARGLKKALGAPPETALAPFFHGTIWRCMDGEVYACNTGANLPCRGRADAGRSPDDAMRVFCRNHPDAGYIPFAATGRTTIYQWRCAGATPAIAGEYTRPDARGFLAEVWHRIEAPE